MGNSLEQHRAAIGCFQSKAGGKPTKLRRKKWKEEDKWKTTKDSTVIDSMILLIQMFTYVFFWMKVTVNMVELLDSIFDGNPPIISFNIEGGTDYTTVAENVKNYGFFISILDCGEYGAVAALTYCLIKRTLLVTSGLETNPGPTMNDDRCIFDDVEDNYEVTNFEAIKGNEILKTKREKCVVCNVGEIVNLSNNNSDI